MITLIRLFLGSMLVLTSLFMILLVLVQRGRGGGLAGALGGMGGQSAFGTKAGDLFTRITVGVAAFWIVLCIVATNLLGRQQSLLSSNLGSAAPQATAPLTPQTPPAPTQPILPAETTAPAAPPATNAEAQPAAAAAAVEAAAPSATPEASAPSAPPAAPKE